MIRLLRLLPTALALLGLLTACAGQNANIVNANRVPIGNDAATKLVFHFTGIVQTFQVPSGVDKIHITAKGAGTPSARGGLVIATISVSPGAAFSILVGGAPSGRQGGYNGGANGGNCALQGGCGLRGAGGAGASDVRAGGSALQDRILIAGGAGGRGGPGTKHGGAGGEGGGLSGGRGDNGISVTIPYGRADGGGGAGGGTRSRGGTPGAAGTSGYIPGDPGSPGMLAVGGAGAYNYCEICSTGSYGLLAGGAGGGGGGGYYGGGGGGSGGSNQAWVSYEGRKATGSGGGGGGGSSFVEPGAQNVSIQSGKGNTGDGLIEISW